MQKPVIVPANITAAKLSQVAVARSEKSPLPAVPAVFGLCPWRVVEEKRPLKASETIPKVWLAGGSKGAVPDLNHCHKSFGVSQTFFPRGKWTFVYLPRKKNFNLTSNHRFLRTLADLPLNVPRGEVWQLTHIQCIESNFKQFNVV